MLHVHRAERADGLIEALRGILADPLADPLEPEVVAVPSRGMERWLAQRMSACLGATPGRSDGVCANVDFTSPRELVGDAVAVACGVDPDADPWAPGRAVWPLLEVVEANLAEPWLRTLSVHLRGAGEQPDPLRAGRRLGTVQHLAELFDRYAMNRPRMLRSWQAGHDLDGDGRALPDDMTWQAELWRQLRERIGQAASAERLERAVARLIEQPGLVALPRRLALFGLTRLAAGELEVLRALSRAREVHLFLLHPSPALWDSVALLSENHPPIVRRRADDSAALAQNRLLASWGQDAREMQLVLAGHHFADHHHPVAQHTKPLLGMVQEDVRRNRVSPGDARPGDPNARRELSPEDRSIEVHACHGRARQVEVLRDAILHLLEDDPTLEPRDVIVMCPDIEAFAPLIKAIFGGGEEVGDDDSDKPPADAHHADLRVRLADRSLRQTNPVLGVVDELLNLAGQRLTASHVLDLADREPVRRRFWLDDEDAARLQDWIADSGIRWGLDAEHRAPFKLEGLEAGTWRAGLDRILLGVTMTEDEERMFAGILPLDDVDSGAIDLVGRLAELIDRLTASLDSFGSPQTVDAWAAAIAAAADALTATGERDAWQRNELQRLLDDFVDEATIDGELESTEVTLPEIRTLMADRLQGRPTRANFRTGHLTICTLTPMRSVPHRVVCLLGLDDGAFPRKALRDGDDLMLDDPYVGDRDPRTEDRQLLLDALLAAGDRLIITYTGNDERTNTPRPPAVPVGELLDTVDATVRVDDGRARSQVEVRHPLQPFDPRNFTAGALVPGQTWSFDRVTLEGARALVGPRVPAGPFLSGPLPAESGSILELDDLVRFAQHPVRAFLRRRLRISLGDFSEEVEDKLPVELDALENWAVGRRLLEARLAGVDGRAAALAEIARGTLPPGVLGQPVIDKVLPAVESVVSAANTLVPAAASSETLVARVLLPDDRWINGTVAAVSSDVLRTVTYSRVAAKHRIASWVRLLVLTAAHPERVFTGATVGRAEKGTGTMIARLTVPAGDEPGRRQWAMDELAVFLDLFDRGMREPIPLYCATSAAYAQAAHAGEKPQAAARKAWLSEWDFDREDKDVEHQLVLGGVLRFEELMQELARPDESGHGWDADEPSRLGRYARRLWDGLLACEVISRS